MKPARNWLLIAGLAGLVLLVALAVAGPWLSPTDPLKFHMRATIAGKYSVPPFKPSVPFPLGSDVLGRDILSGLLSGARYTLLFSGMAVALAFVVALPVGLAAGWRGGFMGSVIQNIAAGNSAIPQLLGAAIFLARIRAAGPDWPLALQAVLSAAVMGIWSAPRIADLIRRMALSVKQEPYMEGAVASGARPWRILLRHLLPNLAPALVTSAVLEYASVLRTLALLGLFNIWIAPTKWYEMDLGEPPRVVAYPAVPEWASYMGIGFTGMRETPWVVLYPGLAFTLAVLVFQAVGEGLRRRWRLQQ